MADASAIASSCSMPTAAGSATTRSAAVGRADGASASAPAFWLVVEGATCTAVTDPVGPGGGSTKASGGGGAKVFVCTPSDPPAFPVSEAASALSS